MHILLSTAYFPPIQYFAALSASVGRCSFSVRSGGSAEGRCPAWLPSSLRDSGTGPFAYIEACENYQKQSYRNRCHFYSASGLQSLSFPVVHENGTHALPITGIRVDYSRPWLLQHKRAIISAYRTSAFFEYYQDELFAVMDRRPDTLWELNMSLIRFFLDKLGLPVELRPTSEFTVYSGICPPSGSSVGTGLCPDAETPSVTGRPSVSGRTWSGLPYDEALDACDLRETIHPKRPDDILERLRLKKPYFQVFSRKYGFIQNLSIMDLLFNEGPDAVSYLLLR